MGQFSVTIYGATGSVLSENQQAHRKSCPLPDAHPAPVFFVT
ncbi:hypothetical protein TRICHSKD4_4894 [Roseibium sp. TrichSKD4]|nr:hypothetical protein TRICHSKD4_4894 [Roseibium sp. TrichSKD4]